jgi:hypothetical protein
VDLVQKGFYAHPVAPLQGVAWAPFCHFAHCVSTSYPPTKQVLEVVLGVRIDVDSIEEYAVQMLDVLVRRNQGRIDDGGRGRNSDVVLAHVAVGVIQRPIR